MKIKLFRRVFKDNLTIGSLFINDIYFCDTLEDKVRDFGKDGQGKIKHKTAIPYGTYQVIINDSVRFKRPMPLLVNVPFFEGIRIHSGNNESNTSGCILLGVNFQDKQLVRSKEKFDSFFGVLKGWLSREKVVIEIIEFKMPF